VIVFDGRKIIAISPVISFKKIMTGTTKIWRYFVG
jgi:hypothetical protein